eukprot:2373977-Prorocentrum_lima.AAC.1
MTAPHQCTPPCMLSGTASCSIGQTHSWGRRGGCAKRLFQTTALSIPVSYTHLRAHETRRHL